AVPAYGPQNDVTLKMPAFEWVHVQLHQQKGMISLSPPTICNSARKSRTFRGGATLIHSHTSKIQASLLMQLYFNIGGEAVLRSVNIKALNKAFRMYHAIRKEVPGMKGARWAPFDITDAWCLASELRSGDAMLEVCDNCKCTYFTSVNQRTCVECPFCKEQGRHGGGEKECA
ncbi:hypothetical protein, partial [Salmonella sp. LSP 259/13]|uniref:hypothetical protein n=4 Tax=Salmonella TaxID=590 RepID=UPI003F5B0ED9